MITEQYLLSQLGITDPTVQQAIINGSTRLLVLDASAHMDWDWLLPYPVLVTGGSSERASGYFTPPNPPSPGVGPVDSILGQVSDLLSNNQYHYSVCETGFLRGFAATQPGSFATLISNAQEANNLRFAGGGITSPDNLLTHGETFIRNYLIGNTWLAANCSGVPVPQTAWIPDDFGHDPQLPVVLQAMGFTAAGFERIPGNGSWKSPVSGEETLVAQLTADKIDFTWTAADGSSIVAHWLIGGYGQGNNISTTQDINTYLALNFSPSPTPYIYVPVLSDFSLPNTNLTSVINQWNEASSTYNGVPVIAICGSFEDYAQLIQFHSGSLTASYGQQFNANPFSTGCYGSRPAIKILHQRATRNLLAAEVFSILATWAQPGGGTGTLGTGVSWSDQLQEAWNLLVPSTHHDYITGTAIPDVFHTEQLTLLAAADKRASWLLQEAMETIAGAINPDLNQTGTPVAVYNPLGFQNSGIVSLTAQQLADANVSFTGNSYQTTADGGLLFMATAPALGYQTAYLAPGGSTPAYQAIVSPATNPVNTGKVVLGNSLVTATLAPNANGIWGLVSVQDVFSGTELIQTGTVANELLFYADGGDEYNFGMEMPPPSWTLTDMTQYLSAPSVDILETGPLRVVVRTSVTYSNGGTVIQYISDYIIQAGEPMLRMRTSGAAPLVAASNGYNGCTVVVSFPLANNGNGIEQLVRGTPYHWTDLMQVYWNDQTFLPTHHFIIPQSGGEALCAIYHSDIPGWGLSNQWNGTSFDPNNGVLYGSLFRNGDGHYYNWVGESGTPLLTNGTDPATHIREYALRVPSGLQPAATGLPLRESLAWATPMLCLVTSPWTGQITDSCSLAGSSDSAAIITVAKPGTVNANDLIFRVYQPTNSALTTTLTLAAFLQPNSGNIAVRGQTALEQDLDAAAQTALNLQSTESTITFTANTAITTLAVTRSS